MNVQEFSAFTGSPEQTVRTWMNRGMPHTKATGASIDPDAAKSWLESKRGYQRRK